MPQLQLNKVVLVHCIIVNNDYQHGSRVLHMFPINRLDDYYIFRLKIL